MNGISQDQLKQVVLNHPNIQDTLNRMVKKEFENIRCYSRDQLIEFLIKRNIEVEAIDSDYLHSEVTFDEELVLSEDNEPKLDFLLNQWVELSEVQNELNS